MSDFEKFIARILRQAHIKFEQEKQFSDLYNGLYRFDFYLPELGVLIEANGMQHYKYTPYFHKSKSDFLKAQERDRRKISYCLARSINLYIIPYWDLENIHTSQDLFKEEYLAKSKFHNDDVYRLQKNKTK